MVKSGLVNDTTVSHYRLSIHLFTAILIISTIFWLMRNIVFNKDKIFLTFHLSIYLPNFNFSNFYTNNYRCFCIRFRCGKNLSNLAFDG